MRHFSQFRGLLPYSQNTALKRKCKVPFFLCFVLKILFEKKKNTVGGTRNDLFGYRKSSIFFRLISKYLLLASQTNINIILQDFLYSFGWRRHWSQWKVSFPKSSHIFWRSIISQSWLANLVQVSYVAFKLVQASQYTVFLFTFARWRFCCGSSLLRLRIRFYCEKSEYKIALHCNTVSSKVVSTNQANKNARSP